MEDKAYCLQIELNELVNQVLNAKDLDKLKELTRLNFPNEPDVEGCKCEEPEHFDTKDGSSWCSKCDKWIVTEPSPEVKVKKPTLWDLYTDEYPVGGVKDDKKLTKCMLLISTYISTYIEPSQE